MNFAAILFVLTWTTAMPHPIAHRTFTIGSEATRILELLIYAPVEDRGDYRCDYEVIEDGQIVTTSHAMGVDSLQALISALQRVGTVVAFSDHAMKRDLYWNDHNDELGLLLPPGCED